MDKREKHILWIVLIGIAFYAALMNFSRVGAFAAHLISMAQPVVVGGVMALFLCVPTSGLERLLTRALRNYTKKPSAGALRGISFALTVIAIVLVLFMVMTLLLPRLVESAEMLASQIYRSLPGWFAWLENQGISVTWLEEKFGKLDVQNIINNVTQRIPDVFSSVFGVVSNTVSVVILVVFSAIIAVYLCVDTKRVSRHVKKLTFAYLPTAWATWLTRFCTAFRASFGKFLSGQCVEAVILGVLMTVAFGVFKLPYAMLVGVLTAVCAIIPFVGAYISFAISVFFTLIIDPTLVIKCAIVYLVTQFVENQFIYPKVVGGSVGLPAFYTLVAALLGGNLFGVLGMLFFIPLAAVLYEFVKKDASEKLEKRKITISSGDDTGNEQETE